MAKVAPIGASVRLYKRLDTVKSGQGATNHVNVEDSCTNCVVVLVENTLKFHVKQESAVLEARLTPVLETTTLELCSVRGVNMTYWGGGHITSGMAYGESGAMPLLISSQSVGRPSSGHTEGFSQSKPRG